MAYVSQELKSKLSPTIKAICKKYGVKSSISVRSHMTLVITLKSGKLDFVRNYNKVVSPKKPVAPDVVLDINPYWFKEHFDGNCKQFLSELFAAANEGNHDNSQIECDYFDVGWYVDVNVGRWNNPYVVE